MIIKKYPFFSYCLSQKFDSINVAAGPWPVINCIMSDHIHIVFNLQTRQGRAATRLAWKG